MRERRTVQPERAVLVAAGVDGMLYLDAAQSTIRIAPAPSGPVFADHVVADYARICRSPHGQALIRSLHAAGKTVTIQKPDAPTDPPNAWTRPDDPQAATAAGKPTGETDAQGNPVLGTGNGSNTTVNYIPSDWPSPTDRDSPPSDVMLYAQLRQAESQTRGVDDPAKRATGQPLADEKNDVERYKREREARSAPGGRGGTPPEGGG